MKKAIAILFVVFFLYGCSQMPSDSSVNAEPCSWCGDEVDRWIVTEDGRVCAKCFTETGLFVCRKCGIAYHPDGIDAPDGLCYTCAKDLSWSCSICGEAHALDCMCNIGDGYYLCTDCSTNVMTGLNNQCVLHGGEDVIASIIRDSVTYPR